MLEIYPPPVIQEMSILEYKTSEEEIEVKWSLGWPQFHMTSVSVEYYYTDLHRGHRRAAVYKPKS